MNETARAAILSDIEENGSSYPRRMVKLRVRVNGDCLSQEEWTKAFAALVSEGVLVKNVAKSSTSSSGKWLATVRSVPCRRAIYSMAK